ncbi:MAG: 8-oxo-dGDP phosphatase [Kribbellaceae bacterium]|nr:8-oxo-dGDP phosphatase [Kribbellaceae bacterium]
MPSPAPGSWIQRTTSSGPTRRPTLANQSVEQNESDRIEWLRLADVPGMIERREIVSGITLIGLQQILLNHA